MTILGFGAGLAIGASANVAHDPASDRPRNNGRETASSAALALRALPLAGEAAVRMQQYIAIYHAVSWIGRRFLANAAGSIVAMGASNRSS